jgi:predicted Rossmann fold flavoprotein
MQEHDFDIIVVGGGPAGMMAAIRASERGRKVLLIERNATLGKKLLISGKGRCNLTNSCDISDFLEKFSENGAFLRNAFAQFFNTDLISFFEAAGLKLKTERGGRVFPHSDRSQDILNILKSKLKNENVTVLFNERVSKCSRSGLKHFTLVCVSGRSFYARRVAICTGGASYRACGSTGDGYELAKKLGHTIVPAKPALVPVIIKEKFVKDWQGISLRNIKLTLLGENKKISERFGELVFTHFGISGPVVLDISSEVCDALKLNGNIALSVNFKPALDHKKLNARFLRDFKDAPNKTVKNIFCNLLPQGLIEHFLRQAEVLPDKKAHQVTTVERKRLINNLFNFKLSVEGVRPVEEGIITRGGVSTAEINPKTMRSKLVKGLLFAGEVIDIDAKTGGYNMQAAFSTGWACGDNI